MITLAALWILSTFGIFGIMGLTAVVRLIIRDDTRYSILCVLWYSACAAMLVPVFRILTNHA